MENVKVSELTDEISKKFFEDQQAFKGDDGFVKLQPYNQVLPRCYLKYHDKIKNFNAKPKDVWISSFPKCGKHSSDILITE